ncbi:MAG: hypothetical protein GX594_00400 [Pirellulaceae bacterium]|nr:hypothetical protein [Pirellulaceae bacterium]
MAATGIVGQSDIDAVPDPQCALSDALSVFAEQLLDIKGFGVPNRHVPGLSSAAGLRRISHAVPLHYTAPAAATTGVVLPVFRAGWK